MERLGEDHLLCVFRQIRNTRRLLDFRLVCRRWKGAAERALQGRVWFVLERCDITRMGDLSWTRAIDLGSNPALLRALQHWNPRCVRVELCSSETVAYWKTTFPTVEELEVDTLMVGNLSARRILTYFPRLRALRSGEASCGDAYTFQKAAGETEISSMATDFGLFRSNETERLWTRLTSLTCQRITREQITWLAGLTHLYLRGFHPAMDPRSPEPTSLEGLTNLRHLEICHSWYPERFVVFPSGLRSLKLANVCEFVTPEELERTFFIKLPLLRRLKVDHFPVELDTPALRELTLQEVLRYPSALPKTLRRLKVRGEMEHPYEVCDLSETDIRVLKLVHGRIEELVAPPLRRLHLQGYINSPLPPCEKITITVWNLPNHLEALAANPCHTLKVVGPARDPGPFPLGIRRLITTVPPSNREDLVATGLEEYHIRHEPQTSSRDVRW